MTHVSPYMQPIESKMYHGLYNLSIHTIESFVYYEDSAWRLVSDPVEESGYTCF